MQHTPAGRAFRPYFFFRSCYTAVKERKKDEECISPLFAYIMSCLLLLSQAVRRAVSSSACTYIHARDKIG